MTYPKCLTCGHKKRSHFSGTTNLNADCVECMPGVVDDFCMYKYVPDNLGHIEKLAKTKGLI